MGNANTEKKKAQKRKVRAKEIQKTRAYRKYAWDELTPLCDDEVLLALKLPTYPKVRDRRCYHYMNNPQKYTGMFGQCLGCGRSYEHLKKEGHALLSVWR